MKSPLEKGMKAYDDLVRHHQNIIKTLVKMEPALKKKPNLVGYAVGCKTKKGKKLEGLCAIFLVSRKMPLKKLAQKDRLPVSVIVKGKKIHTDVVVLRGLELLANNSANIEHYRDPIKMGVEIGICVKEENDQKWYGTAGACVHIAGQPDQKKMLSASHVFRSGLDVIQPGNDHGQGNSTKNERNKMIFKDFIGSNAVLAGGGVDAGYIEVNKPSPEIVGIGSPVSPQMPVEGLPIMKSGATTGVTEGKIELVSGKAFEQLVNTIANNNPEIFANQPPSQLPSMAGLFAVTPRLFATHGDSGSLAVVGPETALNDFIDKNDAFKKLKKDARDALKKSLLHSAVGLLIALGVGPVKNNVVGQEIQLALDALKVELET